MRAALLPLATLSLSLALACSTDGDTKPGGGPVDADGDGVPADDDCDDNDPAVYPGADEYCDGEDTDCDGEVDENAIDRTKWFTDADGDGYGDPEAWHKACEPEAGWVENGDDCDDDNGAVHPDADEVCDEIDNDCDGEIDGPDSLDAQTWYVDSDGDGYGDTEVVDCAGEGLVAEGGDCDDADSSVNPGAEEGWYDEVDSDCDGEIDPDVCDDVPGGAYFPEDPSCTYTPQPPSSWSIQPEWNTDPAAGWSWSVGSNSTRVMMTPVVGQLTDDNGDGFIDDGDIPDIAFNTFWGSSWASYGITRVVSGDGSGEHWSVSSASDGTTSYLPNANSGLAIGDVDGDGSPELLTMTYRGRMMALNADGSFKWVSSVNGLSPYGYPSIADMDGDGLAEVIVGATILDHTGTLVAEAPSSGGGNFAADLDGDGLLEHIAGNAATAKDGTVLWHDTTRPAGQPAVMDWDGDGDGDVLNQYAGRLTVYDESGNVLVDSSISSSGGGAPCVGDLDGDGAPEVAFTNATTTFAMETDGTVMWTATNADPSSGGTPCTTWDFDGDGDFEVLVADEVTFRILDGTDGSELLTETRHASGTLNEQPVPVDVDRDGNTEIVLANNDYYRSGWDGIYVLGEANDEWTSTRTTWNQGAFWSGNINEDMSVPTAPDMPWDLDNSFRSQLSPTADPLAAQDFEVEILGVCEDCTDGLVEVWVSPLNSGAVWGPAGVDVAVYSDDGSAVTLLEVQQTTATLDPGERLAPLTFLVSVDDFNAGELLAVIDDDGTGAGSHNECDETNNEASWTEPVCLE